MPSSVWILKCTTRHLWIERNKKDLKIIKRKLISEEIARNQHTVGSIEGGGNGNLNTEKYLKNKNFNIEEETDTFEGNPALNINGEMIHFETEEEADLYSQRVAHKAMSVHTEQLHSTRRIANFN